MNFDYQGIVDCHETNPLEGVCYSGMGRCRWSVMSSGWNRPIDNAPMNGDYIAFSIEELSTVNLRILIQKMIEKPTLDGIAILFIIILLAGCIDGCLLAPCERPQLSVSVAGYDEKLDNQYRFVGEVRMGGHVDDVKLDGVAVAFYDEDERHMKTITVSSIGPENTSSDLTVAFDDQPMYVLLYLDKIHDPIETREHFIIGLKRGSDGEYYAYTDYDPYGDPLPSNNSTS